MGGDPLAESRKEGPVYGRIPYGLGSLMILQAAKRIADVCFDISGNMFLIYHTDMTERM